MATVSEIFVDGPVGRLEALLELPEGEARAAAVVGHPHPQYGGTMRNTVVFRIARALRAAGLATLRLNYRGVERSEGSYDGRIGPGGEEDDMVACLDHLERELPGLPLWGAGFSFGARTVASLSAREPRLDRLVLVALPLEAFDCDCIQHVPVPTLAVFGGADEFGTLGALRRRYPDLPPHIEAVEVEGADHLFTGGRTRHVEDHVAAWAKEALPTPS